MLITVHDVGRIKVHNDVKKLVVREKILPLYGNLEEDSTKIFATADSFQTECIVLIVLRIIKDSKIMQSSTRVLS